MLQLKMLFVLAYNLTIVKFLFSGGRDFWWWEEGEKLSEGKSTGEIILVGSGISKLSAGGGGGGEYSSLIALVGKTLLIPVCSWHLV